MHTMLPEVFTYFSAYLESKGQRFESNEELLTFTGMTEIRFIDNALCPVLSPE